MKQHLITSSFNPKIGTSFRYFWNFYWVILFSLRIGGRKKERYQLLPSTYITNRTIRFFKIRSECIYISSWTTFLLICMQNASRMFFKFCILCKIFIFRSIPGLYRLKSRSRMYFANSIYCWTLFTSLTAINCMLIYCKTLVARKFC